MKLLITGGCGFLGSNLAAHALSLGWKVRVFDNLSRIGSRQNLEWLENQGQFEFIRGDIRDSNEVETTVREFRPEAIFHLAGQVAMTTSIANPRTDLETNVLGTFNLLEAARIHAGDASIIYSSTNKVYGNLEQYRYRETETRYECIDKPEGFSEETPLNFHSPYGCSKGAADQYMLDYARIFGLKTVVFRHSSMYGGRQYATYDQGWVGWFCQQAIKMKNGLLSEPITISGSGKQVRDVLHAQDMQCLYFQTLNRMEDVRGHVFNIGGSMSNSLSLLELFGLLGELTGAEMRYRQLPARESDQSVFVADITKAQRLIGWEPRVAAREGIEKTVRWVESIVGATG